MIDTQSPAEFQAKVDAAYTLVEGQRLAAAAARPRRRASGGRIAFGEIDLSGAMTSLLDVLAATQRQLANGGNQVAGETRRRARLVSLAAMAELAKEDWGEDYAAHYQARVGQPLDAVLVEQVLRPALDWERIVYDPEHLAKQPVDVLVIEAGIPEGRWAAFSDFVVAYAKYFYPKATPQWVLHAATREGGTLDRALQESAGPLREAAARLTPFPNAATRAADEILAAMHYLETLTKLQRAEHFRAPASLDERSGFDVTKWFNRHLSDFEALYTRLTTAWTAEKFRRFLMGLPRGAEVLLPSGMLSLVERAAAVPQYGVYTVDQQQYTVLPNEALTIPEILAWPSDKLLLHGKRVIYKSDSPFEVKVGALDSLLTPKPLFVDKKQVAFLWYRLLPEDRTVSVGDQVLVPEAGFDWNPELSFISLAAGQPKEADVPPVRICIRMDLCRVYDPSRAGARLVFVVKGAGPEPIRLPFQLDGHGHGRLVDQIIPFSLSGPSDLVLEVQDEATEEVLKLDERTMTRTLALAPTMFFGAGQARPIPPSTTPYAFGERAAILFTVKNLSTEELGYQGLKSEYLGMVGIYRVFKLGWGQENAGFALRLDDQFQWSFQTPVDFRWELASPPTPPKPPFAYQPVSPGRAIYQKVDEVALRLTPQVSDELMGRITVRLERNEELLLERPFAHINRLANRPANNHVVDAAMLRVLVGVGAERDLPGSYRVELCYESQLLAGYDFFVLPPLSVSGLPGTPVPEERDVAATLASNRACFAEHATRVTIPLGRPKIDDETLLEAPFRPKPLRGRVQLHAPYLSLNLAFRPQVYGWRLLAGEEERGDQRRELRYEELADLTLLLFGAFAKTGGLRVGDAELKETFYEGYLTWPLSELKSHLTGTLSEVAIFINDQNIDTLKVTWDPRILSIQARSPFLQDGQAPIDMVVDAPPGEQIRMVARDAAGAFVQEMEISCAGGEQRHQILWELPDSTQHMSLVHVEAFLARRPEEPAGKMEFRNPLFDPEIEAINARVAQNPQDAQVIFQRGKLFSEKGLKKEAERDFQEAMRLGLDVEAELTDFMLHRQAEKLHEEIKALASFFVPFSRKELNIG